jgi:transcription elongation factor Elf1
MSQAQLKQSDVPVTVSCSHCQMEQVVHMVKCLNCGQEFEVQVPDAIIAGPFYPW